MYEIYIDKPTDFSCDVSIKNASLKNSIARLIVESKDTNLVFNGRLENDKCIIPIKRLKGLLEENTTGKIFLEVIVEDTYFSPWKDTFLVKEHTSVKVRVNENKQTSSKPIVQIKTKPKSVISNNKPAKNSRKRINIYAPLKEISTICERFGIGRKNLIKRKNDFAQIIKEYIKVNPEYNKCMGPILTEIRNFLK